MSSARIDVFRKDGTEESWQFDLSDDAPADATELRNALVAEFVGADADPDKFELEQHGNWGSPRFVLKPASKIVTGRKRI